jgi:hypothetical protein
MDSVTSPRGALLVAHASRRCTLAPGFLRHLIIVLPQPVFDITLRISPLFLSCHDCLTTFSFLTPAFDDRDDDDDDDHGWTCGPHAYSIMCPCMSTKNCPSPLLLLPFSDAPSATIRIHATHCVLRILLLFFCCRVTCSCPSRKLYLLISLFLNEK